MKHSFKVCWIGLCSIFSIIFLIAACSQFIPPAVFSYIIFFAIAFPYLFVGMVILAVTSFFIHKKTGYILLSLLFLGLYNLSRTIAVSPGSAWKPAKEKNALRVLTWNVADFVDARPLWMPAAKTRKEMLQMITNYNPDVLCLPEYEIFIGSDKLVNVKKELDSLGYKYILQSNDLITKERWVTINMGVAICSKTPLIDSGKITFQYDNHKESMLYADVLLEDKKVRISTAHLFSYGLFPEWDYGYDGGERRVMRKLYSYKKNVQQRMRETEIEHQCQAKIISHTLDNSSNPVIYCGDMNTVPTSYTYRILRGERQDAFLEKGNGIGNTFYKVAPTLRIDVCFADKAFDVLQCEVAKQELSDHYAVVTDVCWRQ
jgi:endonuclease/exonuclease/phosphatase family metal-dependent hydrolase